MYRILYDGVWIDEDDDVPTEEDWRSYYEAAEEEQEAARLAACDWLLPRHA